MCRRDSWTNTHSLFGIDRIEEWTYCADSNGNQPCRRVYIYDHGDINMAPERPRSVGYDIPFGPRIIERKPEGEFRDLFRQARDETLLPRSISRRREPQIVEPEFVELREAKQPPRRRQRSPSDGFVPPPAPSPRHSLGDEVPYLEMRRPRQSPIIHSPSPPLREHRRRRVPSPLPSTVEVEKIRIRRLDRDKTERDRDKAERLRGRGIEKETRMEREHRRVAEDASRLAEVALRERRERRRVEREAENADAQRRSAEIAAADLKRENDRLNLERRLAEREAALRERERERERERDRERVRNAFGRAQDVFRSAPFAPQHTREVPRPNTDRGAEVIQAAQHARQTRRRERILYYINGQRIERGQHE